MCRSAAAVAKLFVSCNNIPDTDCKWKLILHFWGMTFARAGDNVTTACDKVLHDFVY